MNYKYLECTAGSSFKFYEMVLPNEEKSKVSNGYEMAVEYGRIGSTRVRHVYRANYYWLLRKKFEGLLRQKLNKGYEDKTQGGTRFGVAKNDPSFKKKAQAALDTNITIKGDDFRFDGLSDPDVQAKTEKWDHLMEDYRFEGI